MPTDVTIQTALSFEPPVLLIRRFCYEQNVSEADARERFRETKKFLVLCAANRKAGFSPSKKVDAMWHQFILHSKDYFRFCDLVGGYIHHQPSESRQPEKYTETLNGLKCMFGGIDPNYWEAEAADCDDGSINGCDCCP